MGQETLFHGRSKRELAWRAAAVAQGVAVCAFAAAAFALALSTDRSGLHSPEAAPLSPPKLVAPAAHDGGPDSAQAFYIVSSEEEAAVLRDALAAASNIRHSVGLDFLNEEVLVAASASDAEVLAQRLYEGNRILAAFGVEDWVVNLVS